MPHVASLNVVVRNLIIIKDFSKSLQQTCELLRKHLNKRVVVHCNPLLSFISNVHVTPPIKKLI